MKPLVFAAYIVLGASSLVPLRTAHAEGQLRAQTAQGELAELTLAHERLEVVIDQQHARTTVRQVWANDSDERVEGSYGLRAGEGAVIGGFAYWNGETKIIGEVFERETANEVYRDVTGLGRDPGLLEQDGEGAFSFRIFPIEPKERKRVQVTWDRWLQRDGKQVEYRVDLGRPDAEIDVKLTGMTVTNLSSPSHHITWDRSKAALTVGQPRPGATQLILRWELDEPPLQLREAIHRDPGQDAYVMFTVAAPSKQSGIAATPKDVTLVLDRSGSMAGAPMEHAKAAAIAMVRHLSQKDRLNVLVFDDGVEALYDRPKPLDKAVRAQAVAYLESVRDGGGTNLAEALKRALAGQEHDDRPDVVVFMTDGQSDAQEVLKVGRADTGDVRVFTVGIGEGVEKPLLARLAADKRGRFTFIPDATAIEPAMERLLVRIADPVVVDLKLEATGGQLERIYPRTLPDLSLGDELRIAARVRGDGPVQVTLTGQRAGAPITMTHSLKLPKQTQRPWVGRQWALARVEDLLQEIAITGESSELVNETIELSLAYGFTGPYTSYLAIPDSELTGEVGTTIAAARERKRAILARNRDAAALSRNYMPPGDPVLEVRAPANARQVTARFPFGKLLDLQWDAQTERWSGRFLVPKDVADGTYDVEVVIVHHDGHVEMAVIPYTIDAAAPQVNIEFVNQDGTTSIVVHADEPLREVIIVDLADPSRRHVLRATDDTKVFTGILDAAASTRLRVVATDVARNETAQDVTIGARP